MRGRERERERKKENGEGREEDEESGKGDGKKGILKERKKKRYTENEGGPEFRLVGETKSRCRVEGVPGADGPDANL